MTHSFSKGYSGNLCIFVDPIIFGILFFLMWGNDIRLLCTYMCKTLCKLTHTCGTFVFGAFNFEPHKIATFLSPLYIVAGHNRQDPFVVIFFFSSFFFLIFSSFSSSFPSLSQITSMGAQIKAWNLKIFEESRQWRLGDQAWWKIRSHVSRNGSSHFSKSFKP